MSQWNLNSNSKDVDKNGAVRANSQPTYRSTSPNESSQTTSTERSPILISNPFASEADYQIDTPTSEHNVLASSPTSPIAGSSTPHGRNILSPSNLQRGPVEYLAESTTPPPAGYFHSTLPHRRRVHTWRDSMSSTSSNLTHHRTESNEKMLSTNSTFISDQRSLGFQEPFARHEAGRNGYGQVTFKSTFEEGEQEKPVRKSRASYYSLSNLTVSGRRTSIPRFLWASFAFLCTFFVPDFILKHVGRMKSNST